MCLHAKTLCVYVCTACVYVFNLCSFFLCYPSFFTVGKTTLPLLTHPITKPIHAPMCTYTKAITSPKFQGNQSNSLKTLTSSNINTKTRRSILSCANLSIFFVIIHSILCDIVSKVAYCIIYITHLS